MAEVAQMQGSLEDDPKARKWRIRKRVWDLMEAEGIAKDPRPVHNLIPNFVGAALAAQKVGSWEVFSLWCMRELRTLLSIGWFVGKLGELEAFRNAECVKVNPVAAEASSILNTSRILVR